jgi:hypothetical protein
LRGGREVVNWAIEEIRAAGKIKSGAACAAAAFPKLWLFFVLPQNSLVWESLV